MLITTKSKNKHLLYEAVEAQSMNDSQIEEIGKKLVDGLNKYGGIGISANQIGEDYRACLINFTMTLDEGEAPIQNKPLLLVNPTIMGASEDVVIYMESCLSIPKTIRRPIKTVRHTGVSVKTDNLGDITFKSHKDKWENSQDFFNDLGLLEAVVVQHEIDHLDGILITSPSRRYTQTVAVKNKFGRNDKVMVESPAGETKFVKYKVALQLENQGYKII